MLSDADNGRWSLNEFLVDDGSLMDLLVSRPSSWWFMFDKAWGWKPQVGTSYQCSLTVTCMFDCYIMFITIVTTGYIISLVLTVVVAEVCAFASVLLVVITGSRWFLWLFASLLLLPSICLLLLLWITSLRSAVLLPWQCCTLQLLLLISCPCSC